MREVIQQFLMPADFRIGGRLETYAAILNVLGKFVELQLAETGDPIRKHNIKFLIQS